MFEPIEWSAAFDDYEWVFTLVMPYPDSVLMQALSPHTNGRSNYKKVKATKEMRKNAHTLASQIVNDVKWERARIFYRFYKSNKGTLDESNMIQRMKAAVDGIVDTGLIPDDSNKHLEIGPVHSGVDKINPRIEIVLQRLQVW